MWVAHALTLVRIPLAALFWLTYGEPVGMAIVLGLAVISDALDGWVARRLRPGGSRLGAWLDPFADKLFVVGVLAAIVAHDRPPWWIVAALVARELVLVPLALAYRLALARHRGWRHDFRAGPLGKLATVAQFVALGLLGLGLPGAPLAAVVAGATGLAALAGYVARAITGRRAAGPATRSAP